MGYDIKSIKLDNKYSALAGACRKIITLKENKGKLRKI